jgi:transcriptional regulator with XRE-family HTH domain
VSDRNPETPRAFLAREIRRVRNAKGMNRDELAKALFVSESLVRSWERGTRLIQPDHLSKVEDLVGLTRAMAMLTRLRDELCTADSTFGQVAVWLELVERTLAELAEAQHVEGVLRRLRDELVHNDPSPEWVGKWLAIEDQANTLSWYQPLVVPGLLQTADYARAVISSSGRQVDDLEGQVADRLKRQRILAADHGLVLVVILDEGVLHRPVGGAQVIREQLLHVLAVAEQPNVIVQVIPLEIGEHAGLAGSVGIAAMDGREYAYVDDVFSGDILEHPDDVAVVKRVWVTLHNEALPGRKSLELIKKAIGRWNL